VYKYLINVTYYRNVCIYITYLLQNYSTSTVPISKHSFDFIFVPKGAFDLQNSNYSIEQYKTEQHNIRQNNTWQIFIALNNILFYTIFGRQNVILVLDNLYVGQKVVLWFGEGQKYQFLSCPLPPVYHVTETVLQIKHWTTEVVLFCPSFCSKSNATKCKPLFQITRCIYYYFS